MPTGNARAEWSLVPLDQWTAGRTLEVLGGATPPFGKWAEQQGGLVAQGTTPCWSTRLLPGDQGANTRVTVRFRVQASSRRAFPLPTSFGYLQVGEGGLEIG